MKNIIIDTDAGTDDLMAIAFLLSRGEDVEIEAITVVNGLAHVREGAKNILSLLALAGRNEIPVLVGEANPLLGTASFPDAWRRNSDQLPGVQLPRTDRQPNPETAVDFFARRFEGSRKCTILALGPLTNIGKALRQSGKTTSGVQSIVMMGGAFKVSGNLGDGGFFKTDNTVSEWNVFIDPLAARRVFASGIRIVQVPLDATNQVPIDASFIETFSERARTGLGRFVAQIFSSEKHLIDSNAYYAWDPLAAVVLLHPEAARLRSGCVVIDAASPVEGRTRLAPGGKPNARVALAADPKLFSEIFTRAFAH